MKGERRSAERSQFDLGNEPELTVTFRDPVTDATGWAVIDSLQRGAAFGGVRMGREVQLGELALLSRLATLRYELAKVPLCGARLGLAVDAAASDSEAVLERFLNSLRPLLASVLSVGPDLNVSAALLDRILEQRQLPWRMHAVQQKQGWPIERWSQYQALLDEELEGGPLRQTHIEHSVAVSTLAMAEFLFHGRCGIGVLGGGAFSVRVAKLLSRLGGKVIAVGTSDGGIYQRDGLDPDALEGALAGTVSTPPGLSFVTADEFHRLAVDVLVVTTANDAITVENVGQLKARLIVEAAPSAVSRDAEQVLSGAGASVVPNFASTLGAVFVTDTALRGVTDTARATLDDMVQRVRSTILEIGRLAATLRIPLRDAGVRLACHRGILPEETRTVRLSGGDPPNEL